MARRRALLLAPLALATTLLVGPPAGRADEASDRSWLVGWVEKTISTPDRQIRLGRIDGALSSDVRLDAITIADRKGVWLTVRGVHLVWTRSDLLRGKLTVATLEAQAIEVDRKPEPAAADATTADDAATDFALPDLPVAVDVGRLSVPTVRLPAEIAGRPTVLSLAGRGRLVDGNLDLDLAATRIEPQGGAFSVKTTYADATRRLALDLALSEPKGGFLSTLLALPGEPPIDFTIRGDAPLDAFSADIALAADARPLLAGRAETRMEGAERRFAVDVAGSLESLVGSGGALTGGGSELHVLARRATDGAVHLDRARLKTGVAALDAAGAWLPREAGGTVVVDRLALGWKTASLDLIRPTTVEIGGGRVAIAPTGLRLAATGTKATGTLDLSGSAGRDLALDVAGRGLPLALAKVVGPDLGAEGAVSFDAAVRGTRKAPTVAWNVTGEALSTAASRAARLPPAGLGAKGTWARGATTLDARLALGRDASLAVAGNVPLEGSGLALDVDARLPFALADGVSPGLGARGTLSATAKIAGSLADPRADWTIAGDGLSIAAGRAARLPAAKLSAKGSLVKTAATLVAALDLGRDARLDLSGRVPFEGEGLALDLTARRLPLALADGLSPGLGARGTLSATAKVAGSLAEPTADWTVSGEGLSVAATRDGGLSGASLSAKGRADRDGTTLAATLAERDRLRLAADGRVPFAEGDLAVKIKGDASLALADGLLRERGARAGGRATIDVAVAGALAAPKANGRIDLSGGTLADPETGMRFSDVALRLRFDGDRATLEEVRATTGESGRLSGRGTVGFGDGLPADLTLGLEAAKLAFGDTARSEVGGTLRLSGPLAREPTIAGRLALGTTEITIPERFAANAARLGVKDLAAPPEVARTLALAKPKAAKRGGRGGTAAWRARLDVVVDAPSRLFVRGRGIDAELGGSLRVTGTTDAVVPVGAFELRRGSLDVIGRHIALDKGTVTLTGDLDPTIDFRATSSTRSVSVVAEVTGRASDPALVLSSTPELPQDEVLAQFLFGRGVSDLTGVQMVQLATAAARLAGGPSAPDLLGAVRRSTGLDTLGTTTDSKGNAGLQAGRYVGERIFLGVTAGAGGSTDATVDLDVTRNLKLRGQTGTDGSKAGFVFEKEY